MVLDEESCEFQHGFEEEEWLVMALRAAPRAGATGRQLKALQWQCLEVSRARFGSQQKAVDYLRLVQQALHVVAESSGHERLSVGEAKTILRSRGQARLAGRLGKASKVRNGLAHPDPDLVKDLQKLGQPQAGQPRMELDVAKVTGKGYGTKHQYDATGRYDEEAVSSQAQAAEQHDVAVSHDKLVYRAKLAEQAERYDDMADHMASVCKSGNEPSILERDLLHVAHKNAVGSRREAWHIITSVELKEKSEGHDDNVAWAREYRTKVEGEVQMICNTALGIVDQCLIPKSTGESKAFYLMMKADYYRYIAEFTTGEAKAKAVSRAENAYVVAAAAAAAEDVAVTHPIRLTLALNHSILLHEMQSKPEEAYKVASTAFEDANAEWDYGRYVGCKDSTVIMQLLCDYLTSWGAGRLALGNVESHVEQKAKKGRIF